jgi:hypothetical protein
MIAVSGLVGVPPAATRSATGQLPKTRLERGTKPIWFARCACTRLSNARWSRLPGSSTVRKSGPVSA